MIIDTSEHQRFMIDWCTSSCGPAYFVFWPLSLYCRAIVDKCVFIIADGYMPSDGRTVRTGLSTYVQHKTILGDHRARTVLLCIIIMNVHVRTRTILISVK